MDYIPKRSFQTVSILYGSMSLFLTIVHNVFLLYYVDLFVSIYKIDKMSFWVGEASLFIAFLYLYTGWSKSRWTVNDNICFEITYTYNYIY